MRRGGCRATIVRTPHPPGAAVRFPFTAGCVLFALLAAGCNPKPPAPSDGSPAPRIVETGPPVTEAEAVEFGKKIESAMTNRDAEALASLVRVDDLVRRSVSDFNLASAERAGVEDGIKKSAGKQVSQGWIAQIGNSQVKLLRTRESQGRRSALIRLSGGEGGIRYIEFMLARGSDGGVVTEDVYSVATGELLTQTLRRMLLAGLPVGGNSITASQKVYQAAMPDIQKMSNLVREGQMADARKVYERLPGEVREEKFVHLIGLRTLQDDEPAYLADLERYRKRFPNDPSLDMILLDYYMLKGDAKGLRGCMIRLERAVGGDPALRVMEADFRLQIGDSDEARRLASDALNEEDTLTTAYWVLIIVARQQADHAETLRLLQAVVEKCDFPLDVEAIRQNEKYKAFASSPQYKELCEWMAKRWK